ncbi:MAG: hypothetical protein Fur0034_13770 [Desulfuromonadia bacterium]
MCTPFGHVLMKFPPVRLLQPCQPLDSREELCRRGGGWLTSPRKEEPLPPEWLPASLGGLPPSPFLLDRRG